MAVSMGAVIALIKALGGADPSVIASAVDAWLDDHPEATTTVEDGSITSDKLASALAAAIDSIADKYEKPSGGIPGTDLASGVIPDISGKQDAPETPGTAGQVLGLDANLAPVWTNKGGGGSGGAVDDVQIDGSSIVQDGVANIPVASSSAPGAVKYSSGGYNGVMDAGGVISINPAYDTDIKGGTQGYKPICSSRQHMAVFYGLSKLAGADLASDTVTLGTYQEKSKDAIMEMLGVFDLIAPHEGAQAANAYSVGQCFIFAGKLCKATADIAVGDAIVIGTNCQQTTLMAEINA